MKSDRGRALRFELFKAKFQLFYAKYMKAILLLILEIIIEAYIRSHSDNDKFRFDE